MPGEYVPQSGPMGMRMAPQTMLMHGGPPSHPGITMSAHSPRHPPLCPIDPSTGGQGLDIRAQLYKGTLLPQ
uniref:Meis homeobox 2a n=1 Tax=Salmo trutta TaxID=8032 RepID=A0A673Z068_SALTR